MATVSVTDSSFDEDVLQAEGPVLVDFWAEWCGPCKMIGPALEELSEEMDGKVKIAKLNIDENPDAAANYGVRSIPTMLIFRNGEKHAEKIGAAPKMQLKQWIETAIS